MRLPIKAHFDGEDWEIGSIVLTDDWRVTGRISSYIGDAIDLRNRVEGFMLNPKPEFSVPTKEQSPNSPFERLEANERRSGLCQERVRGELSEHSGGPGSGLEGRLVSPEVRSGGLLPEAHSSVGSVDVPEESSAGVNDEDLVKVILVPVEVFGADSYGLTDAISPWSDCNRARGHIYRREEMPEKPFPNPDDVITIYVPRSELQKFDRRRGEL